MDIGDQTLGLILGQQPGHRPLIGEILNLKNDSTNFNQKSKDKDIRIISILQYERNGVTTMPTFLLKFY